MYRGGELLDTVDQTFAFLDDMSSVGGSVRGRTPVQLSPWNGQNTKPRPSKNWEPRFKSVRDMPGYVPERYPLRSQEWDLKRRQEEQRVQIQRQKEWERERQRRDAEKKEAERREIERVRRENYMEAERAKERARQLEEQLQREELEARREEEARKIQEARKKQEEEAAKQREWDEEKVRRWKIHPPQRINSTSSEELLDSEDIGRHWDVYPSASQDRLQQWQSQLQKKRSSENNIPIGTYVQPPKVPEKNDRAKDENFRKDSTDSREGSSLLKRTKHYLDAIDRMKKGGGVVYTEIDHKKVEKPVDTPKNIPIPPPIAGLASFNQKMGEPNGQLFIAERIRDFRNLDSVMGPAPPPPPPMPSADAFSLNPHAESRTMPNLRDVQSARGALRPIDKRTIEDNTYEPEPKTFKEKLNRLLQLQLAGQLSTTPGMSEPGRPVNTATGLYKTVKTLSKAAMKDKLEEILVAGPVKQPSFRPADMNEQTLDALAKHRNLKKSDEGVGYGRVHLRRNPSAAGSNGPTAPQDVRFSRLSRRDDGLPSVARNRSTDRVVDELTKV